MTIRKRVIALMMALTITFATAFSACAGNVKINTHGDDKISIVTTIFPIYDWVRELTVNSEDEIEITLLMDSGVDLHNYQPTADDMVKISDCDMFIYVGGESDDWVDDALANVRNQDMTVINLLEVLGDKVKEEETVEGMEAEEEENSDEEGPEYDEHVWLSLKNAQTLCFEIAYKLSEIRKSDNDPYIKACFDYADTLVALDEQYQAAADSAATKTLLFGDRFPFRYMTDDYGLSYYAAFSGCSAETEASFETISFLAQKTDELGLKYVMAIEGTDHRIAETIIENTQSKTQQVLTLDSMQSITAEDVENGVTYLAIMQSNLDVLKTALS